MKAYHKGKTIDMGKMRAYTMNWIGAMLSLLLLTLSLRGYSQTCEVTLRNDSLIDANNLVVDIYVRATSGTFYYSQGQYKISFNSAITNGGVISGTIEDGFSDLTNSIQLPSSIIVGSTSWRATAGTIPGTQTACSQISSTGNGTRICRIRLTNTEVYAANAADMMVVTTAPNATAVWYSDAEGFSIETVSIMVNGNLINPVLNGSLSSFNVTGGGTEPAPVGLSGSQSPGINYLLIKDGSVSGSAVSGTGSAISFGNQTAGSYGARAHRTGTYMYSDMSGNVTVTEACTPVSFTTHPSGSAICEGEATSMSVVLAGSSPYTYQWQYLNGASWESVSNGTPAGSVYSGATTNTLSISGITNTGTYQYRCYVTNCSGNSNNQSNVATVTVNTIPTITGTTPGSRCGPGTVALGATASAGTISWYATSTGGTSLGTGTSFTTPGISTTTTYYVDATSGSCTTTTRTAVVATVNPLPSQPTISPAGSVSICDGSSRTLTSSTGVTYLWSTGETTPSISVNSADSYTVQVTNSFGCFSPASLATTVTVNPIPATPTITPTGPTIFCDGGSVTLTSSLSTGYLWSTGATTPSIVVSATGTYWVRVTDANGCQSAQSATTAVTVNPLPTAPTVGTITQPTCSVATGSVVLGGLPSTGTWTLTRIPGGAEVTGSGTEFTVTGLPAGSHTFTVTNSTGCTSAASAPVVINSQPAVPAVPVVVPVTQPTCTVSTGSVGFSGLPSTGIWTITRNPGGDITTGTGTTTTITGIMPGTYTFTVTNIDDCVSDATDPVVINDPPPVPSLPVQTVDCSGGFNHAVVTVTSPTGTGYQYQIDTGPFQTGTVFNDVANGSHTITVRNASGCTATGTTFSINCGCTNPPLVTLTATSGSTCGVTAVTVSGNTFGGSATSVAITENGGGTVTPASSSASPFSFTYTPTAADAGRTVVITVTTNNPLGSPCAAASATYTLTVNANPAAPIPGTVTQPSCANPDGSVMLNNLPATGDWTITRTPGGTTTTGSGTSTTITGLAAGTFTFTVTNSLGCVSPASANVVINAQPDTPSAPVIGTITQPTCALSTGAVAISGLPATGTWTLTRSPGGVAVNGSGTTHAVTGLTSGTYTFTVANATGCISPASAQVVIITQPETPSAPVIGTITHPTCSLATGSIPLENMPATGEWTLIRYPGGITSTGTGTSTTISTLGAGTYNFAVTNASGCTSPVSLNAVINTQPLTPTAPVVGTITHPTFTVTTGSVVLSGLPSSGTWTLTRYPDGLTSQGTGTTRTVTGLEPGTYSFTVTNSGGCTSVLTGDIIINARPGAPIVVINNPPNICSDQTTDLTLPAVTAGSDANLTFTYWTDPEATVAYATPETAPAGTYYIMGTSTAGYHTVKPVVVTADELPVANAGPDQILDYVFGTTLAAEIPGIGTGIWELVSGTGELFNSADPSTSVSGLSIGDNVFSWSVTNGACYPVTDFVTVKVNNLIIPTLITPNQDGANDYFVLRGLETLGRTELTIFDRRGHRVYENRDYNNDESPWGGLDYNSNPLPDDTYFWVLRAENGVSLSGFIVVRR